MNPPPEKIELVRGWTDISLAREGESLAHKLGRDLKGRGIAMMITSDLDRAVETAEIIEKEAGIPLITKCRELRTWGLGELEGSPLPDVKRLIRRYVIDGYSKPKGGESFNQFIDRLLRKIWQTMQVSESNQIALGVVTHHWCMEVIEQWINAGAKPDLSMNKNALFRDPQDPPGTVFDMFEIEDGRAWHIDKVIPRTRAQFKVGPVIIRHATTAWNIRSGK